jgi:hypothetical protein
MSLPVRLDDFRGRRKTMKKPQFLPPMYAPDGPQEINRAQREDRPKPHQIKANASKQTLLEELAEIDAVYAEGEVTAEYEKRGAEIVTLANAAPELLAVVLFLRAICGRQANILSTASEAERRDFINRVYDLINGDGNDVIAKATGDVS